MFHILMFHIPCINWIFINNNQMNFNSITYFIYNIFTNIYCPIFDVLLTVPLSVFISVINQLDTQNLFHNKFISCLYMFRAHVLIISRSKLHYTASGIITPIGGMIPEAV